MTHCMIILDQYNRLNLAVICRITGDNSHRIIIKCYLSSGDIMMKTIMAIKAQKNVPPTIIPSIIILFKLSDGVGSYAQEKLNKRIN